ncbi:uncharacterized protein BT62DRAFT_169561 [Guyanagaster necrorhizus]|uniref:Uncharacterized protein n=1 Tax=Guyanagaster necrorhizus TaxID=856835 RepID=A0A9P7VRS2_9AGAR|nr:uncharacterized protein BT62DRAFT_169561 [Guyanagaster necrorhizus MCA 3950]KAG7445637.1 hypothetical protein BT62DRAFT_169561 [Guyanagaster necrorhizus MCA 3950]
MASKDSASVSRHISEIASVILEEKAKGPSEWERRQWAKANRHLVCATCKENNVECEPMETRIPCNSSVCKQSERACSKFRDELYDRIIKRVPTLDRAMFDEVMSPQRTSTESSGLSLKIPALCPSSASVSPTKCAQNSTSSGETLSTSTKSSEAHPNSGIQTPSQKLMDKSQENDELQIELKSLKADLDKQRAEIQSLKVEFDATKTALAAANERADRETNLRTDMIRNVVPQEQIDALKKELDESRQRLTDQQQIQGQLKNKIQTLRREFSEHEHTTISAEKHRSKPSAAKSNPNALPGSGLTLASCIIPDLNRYTLPKLWMITRHNRSLQCAT